MAQQKTINRLLIANRGEIACRIIKGVKQYNGHNNIETVAVYSESDANSLHKQMADSSYCLGSDDPSDSYLNIEKIIQIAQQSGADAIHPGYGFLSENADFARAVNAHNLIWVGPDANAIEAMGSKDFAKQLMAQAGVSVVPGINEDNLSIQALAQQAVNLQFPIIIKASAGGGGKGMRIVENKNQLVEAITAAKREAAQAFGNDRLIIEHYIKNPRHIEVQILCDHTGQGVYLFDRDCSIQRRYQKIIEEAPAPGLSDTVRKLLGETALKAAAAINYCNAGTVEFLMDENQQFYFMEMNTRLQVEHPVTEMITGVDLIALQLSIAEKQTLPFSQQDIAITGHAIEARIYAEDPNNNFLPSAGLLEKASFPEESRTCRVDTGVQSSNKISNRFDPLLAKIIAHGTDRQQAINALISALIQTHLTGIHTNRDFLIKILQQPSFQQGDIATNFLQTHALNTTVSATDNISKHLANALVSLTLWTAKQAATKQNLLPCLNGWQLNLNSQWHHFWQVQDQLYWIRIKRNQIQACYETKITVNPFAKKNNIATNKPATSTDEVIFTQTYNTIDLDRTYVTVITDNSSNNKAHNHLCSVHIYPSTTDHTAYTVFTPSKTFKITEARFDHSIQKNNDLTAPMNGRISHIHVKVGDSVKKDAALVSIEAMKMEYLVKAPIGGCIKTICFQINDLVEQGTILVDLTPEEIKQ